MRVLAIDTTGPACSAALADFGADERVLARVVEPMARGHAEALMPLIDAMMNEAGVGVASIDRIAVTVGPGSFTGLRVGVAAARALALALTRPAVGVSVFAAVRTQLGGAGPLAVALDARRDEIYLQIFPERGEPAPPCVIALEEAEAAIASGGTVVGTAAALLGHPGAPAVLPLDPVAVARAGSALDPAAHPPRPLYLRKADAKPQHDKRIARA